MIIWSCKRKKSGDQHHFESGNPLIDTTEGEILQTENSLLNQVQLVEEEQATEVPSMENGASSSNYVDQATDNPIASRVTSTFSSRYTQFLTMEQQFDVPGLKFRQLNKKQLLRIVTDLTLQVNF